ncbi:FAD-dependent oxidoreductase [Pseudonocardia sp. N23]|uniref:oxidoreductase n=1 Tax=Pseudonocardia sp. N23 TaxID=1987376 RepID=UPI000C02E951|nr:FAD-dependent oxidoreductase [Pseudonocardia sp. N23]GAY08989.1 NADH:flavin oxidoreductases [Pseudonocardia sp. N23]
MSTLLTDPWPLQGRRAPSRVLFGPHETNLGDGRAFSERHVAYYAERAAGGCGVVVTETASVHPSDHPYERAPLFSAAAAGWAVIAEACRPHGTLVLASLGHAGVQGSTAYDAPVLWTPETMDAGALVEGFAAAAALAVAAGLHGVEIDAGQYALLRQCLSVSPSSAVVPDVVRAVREAAGDAVVGLRLCGDELMPWAGVTPASVAPVVDAVAPLVDYLVPVRGGVYSVAATRPDMHTPPGINRELSAAVTSIVDGRCDVVWQGSVASPALAQEGLDAHVCDAVEMTRAQIADPRLVALVRAGTPARIRPATLSGRWSAGRDPRNVVVSDDASPGPSPSPPPGTGDVLVVGGGPAGMEAARTFALQGRSVELIERADRLGGSLRLAAALPGRDRFGLLVDWWERELAHLGVTVSTGHAVTVEDLDDARARGVHVLLATGSRPRPPAFAVAPDASCVAAAELVAIAFCRNGTFPQPDVGEVPFLQPGADPAVTDPAVTDPAVTDPAVTDVVVSDPVGDAVAIGVAERLAADGHRCTLVTPDPAAGTRLGPGADMGGAHARLLRAGVTIAAFSEVRAVGGGVAELVDVHTGAAREVPCTVVVDCVQRLPDDALRTARPDLPSAGDCVAPRGIQEAVREARSPVSGDGHCRDRRRSRPFARRRPAQGRGELGDDPLFSSIDVGPLRLRNRVVFAAHLTGFAEDGLPSSRHVDHYAARAAGGAGLVVTEEHAVHPGDRPYERMIRGHDPRALDAYRRLTAAVHAHGIPVLAQLNHNGPQSSGLYSGAPLWAPSAVPDPMFREVPVAMTVGQIDELVAAYADVAERCVEGGFDGVEIQCSQASILRAFLAPGTNLRTDAYGAVRGRLLHEVVAAVRAAIGPDRALGVRLGGGEDVPGGLTVADAVAAARLVEPFVDYLSTSVGLATRTLELVEAPSPVPAGYAAALPSAVRAAVSVPVLGAGRYTRPDDARAALAAGHCDLVGVVRGQIADPGWAGAGGPTRTCIGCNQECTANVGMNRPLSCAVRPEPERRRVRGRTGSIMLGASLTSNPARGLGRDAGRVLVVGGGPAGLRAAASMAARGLRVRLVERALTLGGTLALAATAPGRGELAVLVDDLVTECRALGVELCAGVEADADLVRRSGTVVLATGAVPDRPGWAVEGVHDVVDVLDGTADPHGEVLVVDGTGFHEATSTAELLAERGCRVEVATPAMVVGQDLGLTLHRPAFRRRAAALGIACTTDTVVVAAARTPGGRVAVTLLHHPTGRDEVREVDAVVVATAPRPRDGLTGLRIGDALAPRRVGAAIADAERLAAAIAETDTSAVRAPRDDTPVGLGGRG